VLEGIGFEVADLIDAMASDTGVPVAELRVDGGACANDLLMQFQSDILGIPVIRPKNVDTTAMGAAMLAGLGVGLWTRSDLSRMAATDRGFVPTMDATSRGRRLSEYRAAVARV